MNNDVGLSLRLLWEFILMPPCGVCYKVNDEDKEEKKRNKKITLNKIANCQLQPAAELVDLFQSRDDRPIDRVRPIHCLASQSWPKLVKLVKHKNKSIKTNLCKAEQNLF